MVGQGTFAFWADQGTMTTGSFASGSLDITLDGHLAGATASGGTWTNSSFAMSNLVPGESAATSFLLKNEGSTPLTFAVRASATGGLAPGMRFSLHSGGSASNSGTQSAATRQGTCSGSTLASDATLTATEATITVDARSLPPGASESVCVVARLDTGAPNALQGTSMVASFVFDSRQLGS
jgi:hypothetical protein